MREPVCLAGHMVGEEYPVTLVGDIGINTNGSLVDTVGLIGGLKRAGWDVVKFQKRDLRDDGTGCYTKAFLDSSRESPWGTTQREQKTGLEFKRRHYDLIDQTCRVDPSIPWFASPWDIHSVEFLSDCGVPCFKVASALLTNWELLHAIRGTGKPVVVSTGGSDWSLLDRVVALFEDVVPIMLLHCTAIYPCPPEHANLMQIPAMGRRYPALQIGYSGHEVGHLTTLMAVCLGAVMVERHVTLRRDQYGSDQAVSIESGELRTVRADIDILTQARREFGVRLGSEEKRILDEERPVMMKLRRTLSYTEES